MADAVPKCPYVGLQPYTQDDRDYFFGRERDRRIIAANLHATPLTVLYGGSGVGKSSILLAGVVPDLRAQPHTAVAVFREWQRADFLSALKQRVLDAVRLAAPDAAIAKGTVEQPLDELLALAAGAVGGPVFLVFDQFEEYFLYHPESDGEQPFESEFARTVNRSELDASVLVALRDDGLARLDRFRARVPNLLGNTLRLRHLDPKAAEDAIREPLKVYNRRVGDAAAMAIEDELVMAVLQQVRSGAVSLGGSGGTGQEQVEESAIETPFLQLVLTRLWEHETANGSRVLRLNTLRDLGGAGEIARKHLDDIMGHLDADSQEVCARCFDRFVTPSGTKIACRLGDLRAWARDLGPGVSQVMTRLAENRILRPVTTPGGELSYEIFHDVLAPAVLDWRNRYVLDHERLEAERKAAAEAAARERETIRDQELVQVQALATEQRARADAERQRAAEEQRRAEAESERAEERRQRLEQQVRATRRQWVLIGALLVVLIFAVSQWLRAEGQAKRANAEAGRANAEATRAGRAAAIATEQAALAGRSAEEAKTAKKEADNLRDLARRDARSAFSRELAAVAMGRLEFDPERSLILSRYALHKTRSQDPGERDLLAELQEPLNRSLQAVRGFRFRPSIIDMPGSALTAVAVSRNGRRFATAGEDGVAVIWDAASGDEIRKLPGQHQGAVSDLAFGAGTWLVTVGTDGAIVVWDTESGNVRVRRDSQPQDKLPARSKPFNRVVVSPDGATLATAGAAGTQLWSLSFAAGTAKLEPQPFAVRTRSENPASSTLAFSPDGKFLAVGTQGFATVYEVSKGGAGGSALPAARSQTPAVAFSFDGARVATVGNDGAAIIVDRITGRQLTRLEHGAAVTAIAFRPPDSRQIMTVGLDKFARLWDVVSGEQILAGLRHESDILGVTFNPDGRRFVTVERKSARVWDLPFTHVAAITSAALSSDGRRLGTGDVTGTVKVWDTVSGHELLVLPAHEAPIRSIAFTGDDRGLITIGRDLVVKVWDVTTGLEVGTVRVGDDVFGVAVSRDGKRAATTEAAGVTRIWAVGSAGTELGRVTYEAQPLPRVLTPAFSPDGRRLAVSGTDGGVQVWDALTLQPLTKLRQRAPAVGLAFDPSGSRLAIADTSRMLRLWDISGSSPRAVFERSEQVVALGFNPSGTDLLVATGTGQVKQLEVATGKERRVLAGQTRSLTAAGFSLNARHAVMLESGGGVRLAALEVDDMLRFAPYLVERPLSGKDCAKFLRVSREECPPEIQALQQFSDGRRFSMEGDVPRALERFRRASQLDPSGMGKPEDVAKSLASMHLIAEGRRLALRGEIEPSAALFRRAVAIDGDLRLDPQIAARRIRAWRLLSRAGRFAGEGNAEEVRKLIGQARRVDPGLPESTGQGLLRSVSEQLIQRTIEHISSNRIEPALVAYREAVGITPDLESLNFDADEWNGVCWFFTARGHAATVLPACELAGRKNEKDPGIRDSRGVARALTGNLQGAIADVQFFVDAAKTDADIRQQRLRWLEALRKGENPFTPEELKTLESQ
jgi:WD40 repeat protein